MKTPRKVPEERKALLRRIIDTLPAMPDECPAPDYLVEKWRRCPMHSGSSAALFLTLLSEEDATLLFMWLLDKNIDTSIQENRIKFFVDGVDRGIDLKACKPCKLNDVNPVLCIRKEGI